MKELTNLPLTSNQKRLWIMSQQDNTNPAYNLQLTYHIRGGISLEVFEKSLNLLFDRHHTMFSSFRQQSGAPFINIIPAKVNAALIDFTNLPDSDRRKKIFEFASADSRKAFDIEHDRLYRLFMLKENDESYFFHATIHHIIFDGWSRRIFIQELSRIYRSLVQNEDARLEPLSSQSYDYADLKKDILMREEEQSLTDFWKEYLKDIPPELNLPYDFPRGNYSSGLGRRESFKLSGESTAALIDLSKKGNTSLFNTVLSVLGILFQKYTGDNDICIGIPVSNRRFFPGLEKIFGLFINTTVVRLRLDDSNNLKQQISNTRDTVKNALANSSLPFEKVVEAINPERILGLNPLFQVSLSWLTDLTVPLDFGSVKGERITLPEGISPFDITFYIWEEGNILKGDIEYNVDIFKPGTIIRMKESLVHLLDTLAADPGVKISDISIISDADKKKLQEFNRTETSIPECLIQDLFERQAVLHPEKRALVSGEESLTYKELDERSNQLARHLMATGAKEGDVVGICLERSAEMVISVLAVLKAGCCYLPMDPSFPDERLTYMFEDSESKILVTQKSLKERFHSGTGTSLVLVDSDRKKIISKSTEKPALKTNSEMEAYTIYTSGSTGKPKGVKVHHKAVVNLIGSMSVKPGIKEDDILLAVVTLSFDMSVYELFVPLSTGATVVVAGSQAIAEGSGLISLIEKHNVTIIQATPSLWNILLTSGWKGKKGLKALCGGEALTYGLVRQILPLVGEFWNCYGPTETTVYATCTQVTDPEAPIHIGKPLNNTTIHIVDRNNNLLPAGVTGEVAIGGTCVTKGYHKRPDLTSEKFIKDGEGRTIYKTGDLGRFLDDGNVELFGRIDNQIKLRGFRIEPGEIETLLTGMPFVREAVVKVTKFDDYDERLIAFLNVESGFNKSVEEISEILSLTLPPYMIPSFYQTSDGFPRLPNGKINKKALIYEISSKEQNDEIDPDSITETQKKLLGIWEDILKLRVLSLKDNFFNNGGNSLLGIRMINRIKEAFGIPLNFRDFLANSSIDRLAILIDSQTCGKEDSVELVHLTATNHLPLTNNQKRLWLISRVQPDVPAYIIRSTHRFKGAFDPDIFRESLNILFRRHYTMFSVIKEANSEPYCEILPGNVIISFTDYSSLSVEIKQGKVRNILNEDSMKAFDLESGPLYRIYLIKTAEDEYIFHLSIHHIIFDGWSMGVLNNDLSEIYNGLKNGNLPDLEDLQFQQFDYAHQEKNLAERKESVSFWEKYLDGCSPVLNFPFDAPRRDQASGRGALEQIKFSKSVSDALKKISRESGTSLFTTIMSGFGILLNRYSGEDDLNIGMPLAYRPHTKLEKIFGMFVNTVVLRLKFDREMTFRELIKKSNDDTMDAIAHQDLSFERVVEIVNPQRASNANPLFQFAFAWQNSLGAPLKLDGVKGEVIKQKERNAIFDLTLALWENGDIIEGEIEFNKDILHAETIIRLKTHFLTLMKNLVSDLNKPFSSVPMIAEADLKKIAEINNTVTDYPGDKTIAQIFEEIAEMFPDKKAIVYNCESYTYRQLNEQANQLARTLRKSGVGRNTPVGILSDKSPQMIVGILAILKAGGCYTPIDPDYPEQRMNFIAKDSGVKIILVQNKYMGIAIEGAQNLKLAPEESSKTDTSNLNCINHPDDLAYILYTSGTTGTPKGTPAPQRGVIRLVCNTSYYEFTPEDRILFSGTIVFDASVIELFGALLNGGTLYIISKETLISPEALGEALLLNKITLFVVTSAVFTHLAEKRIDIFRKLRALMVGGDVLSPLHANMVRRKNPKLRLINGYGPTENSTLSTYYIVERDFERNIPIGRPNSNSTVYVFDRSMNYQPAGVPGELYVGGVGLSPGYLNREDLNKTSFLENPYKPGERIYKTGDLVRWLPDLNLEFLGRVDNQLKIRGFRVELEEIESTISKIEGIVETVIKPVKVEHGDYRLIAFLNVSWSFRKKTSEILNELRATLPSYMIPAAFKIMHEFPKNTNGKTDRKALSVDMKELGHREIEDVTKLSHTARVLHKIWCTTLKTDDVLTTDNFFDLGGNSLLVIRVLNQVNEKMSITLTFKDFLSNPSINQLGSLIDSRKGAVKESVDLVKLNITDKLPLTNNQKRLWFFSQMQPGIPMYIIPVTYKFVGSLDKKIFEKSLGILFKRHQVVFSVIREEEGEPYCEIVPGEIGLYYKDLTDLTKETRLQKVKDLINKDSRKPFDLSRGPLYRLHLIKTEQDEHIFHMTIHHIIFDGWSLGVMANDLSSIYNSLKRGEDVHLSQLDYHQYDYAYWEEKNEVRKESMAFWEENLKGCTSVINFPFDYPRNDETTGWGGLEVLRFSKAVSDELRKVSKEQGTSLFALMLTTFGILIQKYTGEDDLNIGLPLAYRPHTRLENIFGMFVNTVVVRLKYNKGDTFRDLIKRTGEAAVNAISHQDLPFDRMVKIVNPDRSSNANPLFQVDFAWQNNLDVPFTLDNVRSEKFEADERISIFDLSVALRETGDIIEGEIDYNMNLIKPESAKGIRDHFLALVNNLLKNIDAPLISVSMMTEEELQLISKVNDTGTDYPKEKTPARLFEEYSGLYPDNIAAVYKDITLTYKQLNEKANQLARTLREAGVVRNTPVGLYTEKSVEMIIGIMGILKAGGGYVPIDPEYPEQRISFIIKDSGCKIILTKIQNDEKVRNKGVVIYNLDSEITYNNDTSDVDPLNIPSDLGYVIYTSGTTGIPKGTPIPMQGIVRMVCNANYFDIKPGDRVLQCNAIVFDSSVEEIFGALLNGGALYIIDKEILLDPGALGDVLLKNEITLIDLPSSLFAQISESRTDIFSKIKYLLIGGDVVSPPHVNRVRKDNPQLIVINGYGPTENSCNSTSFVIDRDFETNIPIGKPVSNATAYIFDRNMNYQPLGVTGELYVGGDGLSPGYLNREDLNKICFIDHPKIPGEKIYKTGDLARWLPDGNIEFRGRVDNQLKIRGFRVELEEIESVISKIEGVIETVIKPVKIEAGNYRLVAFLNVPEKFRMSEREIMTELKLKLPVYMLPSAFKFMHGFPKHVNGKTDRKALIVDSTDLGGVTEGKTELSPIAGSLRKIWSEALKVNDVSITDDFFEIGGNSLLIIKLLNQIKEKLNVTLTFREFIDNPTIRQLAELADSKSGEKEKSINLIHQTHTDRLPLTSNQRRLWLISQLQPDLPVYIIPVTYRFLGNLGREIFEKSLGILFERHHIVFSVMKEENGEPYCELIPREVKVAYFDFSTISKADSWSKVNALINEDAKHAFNLGQGPLYRLYLIRTDENEYYFHMSIHHIIFDGWSAGLFTSDLAKIYNNLSRGEGLNLEELKYQQYDYALWEQKNEIKKESIAFWEENLRGSSPFLNFPYDYQRSGMSAGKGGLQPMRFKRTLSKALKQISKEEGASLFTTLLSGFGVLLHKYSGETDLNIGMPVAHRPHTELEKVFGMFVNTVVVRLKYEKGETFRDLIRQGNEAAVNAISNQDVPFDTVVEAVKPERIPNTNPLFQVAFAWQNNLGGPLELEGIKSETIQPEEWAPIFDFHLYLWENKDYIEGGIEFNRDVLKPETVARLRSHFMTLLENLVENIDEPVDKIPMVSEDELALIGDFNKTKAKYPKDKTIAQLFEGQVKLYPEKTAVVFQGKSLTYKQLNQKANQLARTLRASGVRGNTPVGILTEKSMEMAIGILGIIKAGAGYVPVDPEYPEQRRNYILEDSGCKILLIQNKFSNLPFEGLKTIDLDSPDSYDHPDSDIERINGPSDLAYIMYTSGTTGKPKGSMILQYSVIRLIRNTNYIELTPDDRLLLTGAIVFDATTFEMWGMLLNGGTLFIVEKDVILDPEVLGRELKDNDITILWITSALLTQIADQRTDIFSGLNYILTGGDVISAPHINKIRRDNPDLKLVNCYGPTENTTFSTTYLIEKDFESNIPIGKPISNSTTYIFDREMNYQPVGVIGELYVGGDGLSAGYLNREDLNRISFTENPCNPGERLYKTGDLARWLPDGNIEFHGRADNQLKIRGFRVELEEIESVISDIDGVIETVIKPVRVEEGDYKLIAFLNVPENFKPGAHEILSQIRTRLPAYMLPSAFKLLHGFPKTINGKTDKKALTFELSELISRPVQERADFSPAERALHKIWCDALKTDDVSLTDNFFDIGGNSLLGLRIINIIKENFKITIPFRDLVTNPTIEHLSAYLNTRVVSSEEAVNLVHLTGTTHLPLTRNQKRLWVISKLQPDIPLYVVPITYRFTGVFDKPLFEKSINILFRRHNIVFSVIREEEGKPFCNLVTTDANISYIDYSGIPEDQKVLKVRDIIDADSRIPFNLEQGPLFRLYLIKTSGEEHYFHISIHHIIFDGWSVGIFINDLNQIYNNLKNGKEVGLEPLEFQQYDYAQWESGNEDNLQSVGFWKDYLKDCSPVLNFPWDFQRKEHPSGKGGSVPVRLSAALSDSLRKISKKEGASLFSTLMSVFGSQLHKYSGEDDINLGLPVAYRPHSSLEKILGMFVNTVVIRMKYEYASTFRDLIRQTSEATLNAISHQDLSFESVVELVKPERISGANPLFQAAFEWQNNLRAPVDLTGLKSEHVKRDEGPAIFDLSVVLWENGDIIEGEFDFSSDLLKQETIVRFKENFIHLLESMVQDPDQRISDVSITSLNDKERLEQFNNTATLIPDCLIQNFFEDQSIARPEKTAIINGDTNLSFRDLDRKANQIARFLISLGVKNGDVVGICLERSIEMVASVLGVLKAGCCYLPLDPSFPQERLNYMLEDSGSKVLISQSSLSDKTRNFKVSSQILTDKDIEKIDTFSVEKPEIAIDSESDAYIIYTSGSTGKPKGVPVRHKSVVNLITSMTANPGISWKDRLLAVVTLSFDMSVYELFLTLSNGATLIMASSQDVTDANALTELIEKHDITIIQATPSLWNILLSGGWKGKKDLKALCGGEALSPSLIRQILPKVGEFWNCYGPTEITVYATCARVMNSEDRIHIGKPLNNTRIYILDKGNKPLPVGVIGEVAIGGTGVSEGYHNRPDLTAVKFIKTDKGEIIYKTGDQGRFIDDGNVELFGRVDNQIKLRGFRIEPGEIESLLSRLPGIKEAVVKIHRLDLNDDRLAAFLNCDSDFSLSDEDIRNSLADKLPSYMLPSFYKKYNDFPKLPNGKIDKKALKLELFEEEHGSGQSERELTMIEKSLFDIWSDILKTRNFKITDNFFVIGGNSLLAISIIPKMESAFNITLGLKVFFDSPRIKDLADIIDIKTRQTDKNKPAGIKVSDSSKIIIGEI